MATRKKRGEKEKATAGGASGKAERQRATVERQRVTAELRALAHPLRLRVFELFAEKPRTTMQVAEILGEPPTRLYHHVNALQKTGLLRLKETRPIRGAVEKYFEAVQPSVSGVRAGVLTSSSAMRQSARAVAATIFEQGRQDLFAEMSNLAKHRDPAKHHDPVPILVRVLLRATPAQATKVRHRLIALMKELKAEFNEERLDSEAGARAGNQERWALTLAFARSWPQRKSDSEA